MPKPRCEALTRRRFGLAAGGFLGAPAALMRFRGADARKKRKRKRKKRRQATPSACARACGTACSFCFHRAVGSLLCGDGAGVACDQSCTADDECTDPLRRYCLVGSEHPVTGMTADLCLTPGGHCGQVNVCEA